MIARFFLVLPFDIFIPESGEWPMLDIVSDAYRARVHFPSVVAERPDATASVIGTIAVKLRVENLRQPRDCHLCLLNRRNCRL